GAAPLAPPPRPPLRPRGDARHPPLTPLLPDRGDRPPDLLRDLGVRGGAERGQLLGSPRSPSTTRRLEQHAVTINPDPTNALIPAGPMTVSLNRATRVGPGKVRESAPAPPRRRSRRFPASYHTHPGKKLTALGGQAPTPPPLPLFP